jgi:hypothetical protein
LVASVEAASDAETVFGLAEALAHLERALRLWASVPDAAELATPGRAPARAPRGVLARKRPHLRRPRRVRARGGARAA